MFKRSIAVLAGLLCSASVFAGITPTCHSDTFNMAVVNKNLVSDDCWDGGVHGTYCLYRPQDNIVPASSSSCADFKEELFAGDSMSVSKHQVPQSAEIDLKLYNNIDKSTKVLKFNYNAPNSYKDNCSAVFGGDVSCVITKTTTNGHTTYTLLLSKLQ